MIVGRVDTVAHCTSSDYCSLSSQKGVSRFDMTGQNYVSQSVAAMVGGVRWVAAGEKRMRSTARRSLEAVQG